MSCFGSAGVLENLVAKDVHHYKIAAPDSVRWSEIAPWQATYWKTLPKAYQAEYSFYSEAELKAKDGFITSHEELWQLRDRARPAWYTDYITEAKS